MKHVRRFIVEDAKVDKDTKVSWLEVLTRPELK